MSVVGERRVTLEDAQQTVQDRLVGTFATVVRLLHDSLGWRVQFVGDAQREIGASAMSPIAEQAVAAEIAVTSRPDDTISQPVTLESGESWGRLVCFRDEGVAFGSVGGLVLDVLARVIATETDANLARRATLDARRTVVRSIIDDRLLTSVFQPVVELRTMRVVGVEALARFDAVEESTSGWFDRARGCRARRRTGDGGGVGRLAPVG